MSNTPELRNKWDGSSNKEKFPSPKSHLNLLALELDEFIKLDELKKCLNLLEGIKKQSS